MADDKRSTLIHFKSSPDIVYYEKSIGEAELAGCADDKKILAEDLSTAEKELDETAKALYHRVLSNLEAEGVNKEDAGDVKLRELARQMSDTAINSVPNSEKDMEAIIEETARELASTVMKTVIEEREGQARAVTSS